MQGLVGNYLEQSLKMLAGQQQQMREQMRGVVGSDAYDSIATLTQKNLERWRSMQEDIFRAMSGSASAGVRKERDDDVGGEAREKRL